MAEGQGLEPQFSVPEPGVLPLDDPSVKKRNQRKLISASFPDG
jgi:hypothetical protein